MTVTVSSTSDLWRVCLKSKWARIEIPELEFEISADGKRHTDSIYNHIASAVDILSTFVSGYGGW
jgi:C4-type Zn-finger protein